MTVAEIREKYLQFMASQGHTILPSASLVPENDPTTLFTGSGMQPLVPYLLGKNHPAGVRLTNSQKCFRSMDIEEVGDNRHTTFFEMLGNWSLGDYFKQEQLPFFFEFLTKEIGLDPKKLYVTVFIGDEKNSIPKDTESVEIWKKLFASVGIEASDVEIGSEEAGYQKGMQGGRIFYYDAKKNWWSRAGVPENMPAGEPGGPDSEVFYDFGTPHDEKWGKECHPNCDCGRFLEIGNSVFMQYIKKEDGSFGLLPKQNVDFGGGLERIATVSRNQPDVFLTTHASLITHIEEKSGKVYVDNVQAFRIVADHIKAAVFLIAEEVRPGNAERGYLVRRLIRRAIRFADILSLPIGFLKELVPVVVHDYKGAYPDLSEQQIMVEGAIAQEEEQFRKTLAKGLKELEKGTDAFTLFTTYGFPLELTQEIAKEKGIDVDVEAFKREMEKHSELSRAGSEKKFKGGLADASEKTTQLHTTHHLLLKALQMVLGSHVKQRGSNITQERLRIDFSHGEKMTDEQKKEVERIVNEQIQKDTPVVRTEMAKEDAEKLGAEHEFGAKYPDRVSVYSVGPLESAFSIEFCGGPHVEHTGAIKGTFKIQKEEAVAAGIRRIKGVLQ